METRTQVQVEVLSIGLNDRGAAVVRVRFASGAQVDVATDTVSFAKLAAAGARVVNEYQRQTPKG
jgi:hypothetical protein